VANREIIQSGLLAKPQHSCRFLVCRNYLSQLITAALYGYQ